MRATLSVLCALLSIGALGCYNVVAEPDEAAAVAEALTRAVRFNGGEVVDGKMPQTDDDSVWLVAPELPTEMSPGETSLMGFGLESDEGSVPVDDTTTLVQFNGSRRHIRVPNPFGAEDDAHVEHSFDVDSDVCVNLCNKQHQVEVMVAILLGDGGVSRRQAMRFALDCRETGDPGACKGARNDGASAGSLSQACQNAAEVCGELSSNVGIGEGGAQCIATYGCVQSFYSDDSFCRGLVDDFVACLGKATGPSDCNACAQLTSQLTSNCEEPVGCLDPMVGGDFDAGAPVSRADSGASLPPVQIVLTDSLRANCAAMCGVAQEQACSTFTDTCEQDCEGGFVGTACEQPLVEFQRCIWKTSGDMFTCDKAGMPTLDSGQCPGEQQMVVECIVNNPDLLPRTDAGMPAP